MKGSTVVLSTDRLFAEMLIAEFDFLQIPARVTENAADVKSAELVLWDMDTVHTAPKGRVRWIIGFTKSSALSARHAGRECTLVLRRPFELRLLRQEIANLRGASSDGTESRSFAQEKQALTGPELLLDTARATLCYGDTVIPLGPNEARVMECLLEGRGEAVSRDTLSKKIGASSANKVEVYICYLRRKMRQLPEEERIVTLRGKGYALPKREDKDRTL